MSVAFLSELFITIRVLRKCKFIARPPEEFNYVEYRNNLEQGEDMRSIGAEIPNDSVFQGPYDFKSSDDSQKRQQFF